MIVKRFVSVFKAGGAKAVLSAVLRRMRTPHARSFRVCKGVVTGGVGIEIGGPSPIFARGGLLPVYSRAQRVDNCNFASRTIWEGAIREGSSFNFHPRKAPGRQFVAEGADLHMIPSESYDFVLSSHMLEHTANPLRALSEWARVLKPGGALLLVVPHRDGTFDHRRPVTTLVHLIADFERGTLEDDATHVSEILQLHDLSMDSGDHDMPFPERAARNAELRSLHQHVFDTRLVIDTVKETGLEVQAIEPLAPYHVVAFAQKQRDGDGASPLSEGALHKILRNSPFPTDRASS